MKNCTHLLALFATAALAAPPAAPPPAAKGAPAPAAAPGAPAKPAEKPKPLTPEENKKALYTLGVLVVQRTPLGTMELSAEEKEQMLKGFGDAAMSKPLTYQAQDFGQKVDQFLREKQAQRGEIEKKKGAEYLTKAATEPGAQKLPSGLVYTDVKVGEGPSPAPTDKVKVHYKGTLTNGTEFDSSYKRGTPTEFPLNGVIKCWTEGVGKMKVGGKAKLVCPSDIAYGERGMGSSIPPNSTLVFEVELISIEGK